MIDSPCRVLDHIPVSRERGDVELASEISAPVIPAPRPPVEPWNGTAARLAGYAQGVLSAWIASGAVLRQVRAVTGIGLPWSPVLREPDVADELAGLTVAVALNHFHRTVIGSQGWDATRGARMETLFVSHCLLCFPNEYRRWRREHRAGVPTASVRLDEIDEPPDPVETELVVLDRMRVAAILRETEDPRTRTAIELRLDGYSHADIAEHLGITAKAVEMLFYRLRARLSRD
ncbi:hypothetical protein GCM10022247_50810 [Allokutzneria multivorans]|uniref:RNA polymerase sigma factor 70 region 4 type 2 domain-containing protein n=1 Tax=Allokutzneria multivorans TaxID=1142134 RepID=A0ABP7T3R9_9PSEU